MNNTRTFFSFKDKATGELVRLECIGRDIRLTSYEGYPVFEAKSAEQLANILEEDTPQYNVSSEIPGWGCFEEAQLVPVKVTITTQTDDVVLPELPKFKTIEVRSIPGKLASRYAGVDIEPAPGRPGFAFWLVRLPEGETLESAQRLVGQLASAGGRWTKRHVYAMVAVPEEYEPLTKGASNSALCIATDICH